MSHPSAIEQGVHRDTYFGGSQTRYEQACEHAARSLSRAEDIERLDAQEATSAQRSSNGLVTFH